MMEQRLPLSLLPAQRRLLESRAFVRAFIGGYGAGKTRAAALLALWLSYRNPGLWGMLVSPTFRMIDGTTWQSVRDILDAWGLEVEVRKTEREMRIPAWNGVIRFASADRPELLKGSTIAWMILDEPGLMDEEVWPIAMSRVRHPDATERVLALCGTPEGLNWLYDILEGDRAQKTGAEIIRAATEENPFLPTDYATMLRRNYDEHQADSYLNGQFVALDRRRAYGAFDPRLHVLPELSLDPTRQVDLCFDFNVNPMSVILCQTDKRSTQVLDEVILPDCDTERACREVLKRLPNLEPGFRVFGDASGTRHTTTSRQSDYQIIRRVLGTRLQSMRVPSRNPPVRTRLNTVNAYLRERDEDNRPVCGIHARCKTLIRDLLRVTLMEGSVDELDKRDSQLTHASDAFGYRICRLFPLTLPSHNETERIVSL